MTDYAALAAREHAADERLRRKRYESAHRNGPMSAPRPAYAVRSPYGWLCFVGESGQVEWGDYSEALQYAHGELAHDAALRALPHTARGTRVVVALVEQRGGRS